MGTGEAAAAWRLHLLNWYLLGAIGAAFALALALTDFSLSPINFAVGCGFVAVYAAFSFYNALAPRRRDPQVVYVLGGTAQIVLTTLLFAPFTYIAAAANFPMQDANLLAIDRAFGLDWLAYVTFVDARPTLASWLDFGYSMIKWPLFIVPVVLAALAQYRRLQEYTLAFALALIATTVSSTLVPAIGVFQQIGVAVTDFPNVNPVAYLGQVQDLPAVRGGGLRVLDVGALSGIITFPSFHAASAALYTWALWGSKWFRPIAVVSNLAMLAATPITGGHYFVDLAAGIAVAILAIAAAKVVGRRLAAEAANAQAAPQPA
ncbi:MAG: phosphatase PAP2 family protein [Alphaproteobacteria bacterium]|nr:phosphatase PAP2 family protein [Alphaproteobacteria bacterium]